MNQIVEKKKRWAVSGVMSADTSAAPPSINVIGSTEMLYLQATELGDREAEPFGVAREQSVVWEKVLQELWKERVTKTTIAEALCLPNQEIENLLFGLATKPPPKPQVLVPEAKQLRLI